MRVPASGLVDPVRHAFTVAVLATSLSLFAAAAASFGGAAATAGVCGKVINLATLWRRRPRPTRNDGRDHGARQAPRLHLSVERDLRRDQRLLGLRSARRRAQAQRQERVVARYGRTARRRRRVRFVDHHASADVWKASGHVEAFHDEMVDCKVCKHRFRADHLNDRSTVPGLREQRLVYRAAQLQPDDADGDRPDGRHRRRWRTCGRRRLRASSSTSRTSIRARARGRRSASRRSASRSATRSRRATSPFACASSNRRSSSISFPTTATTWRSFTSGSSARKAWYCELRHRAGAAALLRADRRGAPALREGRHRRRVSLSRGDGASSNRSRIAEPTTSTRT